MIEVTAEQIDRVSLLLHGIKGARYKAFYNALARTGTTTKQTAAEEAQRT